MVATISELISDSETELLENVYVHQRKPIDRALSRKGVEQVLESYMVFWMMGAGEALALVRDPALLERVVPRWKQISHYAKGQVRALEFQRQRMSTPRGMALTEHFDFKFVHEVVGSITRSFASFWESECATMKDNLLAMDSHGTGRVPLARFYGTGLEEDWRFGESEAYLRDLGALDETSGSRGKQVIIPNYMEAASNCIVSTVHYSVCCQSHCEALLSEIEVGIGAPSALPAEILAIVANMTSVSQAALEDRYPQLDGTLTKQLGQIAEAHGGQVPLHGRLFGQWLHYSFPQECPFPHKSGTAVSASPTEYGKQSLASKDEMTEHASLNDTVLPANVSKEELEWMSQWSEEEELVADYAVHLRAPWERSSRGIIRAIGGFGFAVLVLVGATRGGFGKVAPSGGLLPTSYSKAHFV